MATENNNNNDPTTHVKNFIEAAAEQERKAKKAETARINGSKSKGPTSRAGRDKSSRNGIRHGLTARKHILLATEFPDEYEEVYQAYVSHLRPVTKAELRLVQKIANLDWRLERFTMLENCALNLETAVRCPEIATRFEEIDGIGFIYESWKGTSDSTHCLDLLRRYQSTLQHQLNSTVSMFFKFERQRLARSHDGRDLDERWNGPYQPPAFTTLAESEAPPPAPPMPEPKPEPPAIHLIDPLRTKPTDKQPLNPVNKLWKPPKDSAA